MLNATTGRRLEGGQCEEDPEKSRINSLTRSAHLDSIPACAFDGHVALVGEVGKWAWGGWHLLRRASLALGGGPCRLGPGGRQWRGVVKGAAAAAAAACTGRG